MNQTNYRLITERYTFPTLINLTIETIINVHIESANIEKP